MTRLLRDQNKLLWFTPCISSASTNTNAERTLNASEGDTGEVLLSQYECNCTSDVGSKATGEPLPLMIVFQGPVPVEDKDKWPWIGGFHAVLDWNTCGSNNEVMIIKH